MFKEVKGFKKEDLKCVAEEISGNVPTNAKITELKDIIVKSDEYKSDPEFVKILLQNTISERKIREEKEEAKIQEQKRIEEEQKRYEHDQERKYQLDIEKAKMQNELELTRFRLKELNQLESQPAAFDNANTRRKFKFTLPFRLKRLNQSDSQPAAVDNANIKRKFTLPFRLKGLNQLNSQPAAFDNANTRRKSTLPKLEFQPFGDDLKEWLPFWNQFQRIDQDGDIATEDKFQYLVQATVPGSKARETVESFLPTNYPKAIDCLKTRFGKKDLLIEVYVRKLLELDLRNETMTMFIKFGLSKLYNSIESSIQALETLGVTKDKDAAWLHPLVESCMPKEVLQDWQKSPNVVHGGDPKDRLDSLLKFLKSEVESQERFIMGIKNFGLNDDRDSSGFTSPNYPTTFFW